MTNRDQMNEPNPDFDRNGPESSAFPIPARMEPHDPYGYVIHPTPGLTLREYFAGQALIGLAKIPIKPDAAEPFARLVAIHCVAFADALLKELNE